MIILKKITKKDQCNKRIVLLKLMLLIYYIYQTMMYKLHFKSYLSHVLYLMILYPNKNYKFTIKIYNNFDYNIIPFLII
jgi:hypothetical protein